jgi:hypothetical protein
MAQITSDKFVKIILLINGIIDIIMGLVMIFGGSLMGGTTSLEFYIAGGWGIGTLALGIWRIWASKNPETYWFTAMGGIFEGGILAIYSIIAIPIYSLTIMDTGISLAMGTTFSILYIVAFVLKKRNS